MKEKEQSNGKNEMQEQDRPQARLAWHRPKLQHLKLSLDTAMSGGSGADAISQSIPA